ncbi:hypothetical protein FA95DRAFT_1500866 [Auriscalpium vulgare]|uniref:Uncharacterized protein n=1 Tax=Auriscalpium vulgare TaxID=40419 RepID=A0ACB8RCT5_9AGAM|nr:hypothetical protein FA95DRAFT_1500866 [Auriscalpium vulgare]
MDKALEGLDPFSDSPVRGWTGRAVVDSPSPKDESRSFSPTARSASPAGSTRPRPSKKASMLSTFSSLAATEISDEPPSPSKRRWDSLRHHVLPHGAAPPRMHQAMSSVGSATPPRPSTPKQFRMPRLGFKQVVEQAQEVSVDQARRFADEVMRACLIARSGEQKGQKREREGTLGLMAAMNFMNTTTSLATSASSSTTNFAQPRVKGPRRPPSLQSVATAAARGAPASSSLYAVIIRYASLSGRPTSPLPHEAEVLSALLMPFLSPLPDAILESERVQAIETFETVIKSWIPGSNEGELERCAWCCKAAQGVVESRPMRMRILGVLSSCLFSSEGSFRGGSPIVFQSLLQTLFSLFASFSSSPTTLEESQFLRELIGSILQGSLSDLDHELVEQEYDVRMNPDDSHAVVDALVVIALSTAAENVLESQRPHLLRYLANDFWSPMNEVALPPANLIPLYARKLVRCAHALFNLLPPVGDSRYLAVPDTDVVLGLMQTHLLPEAQALQDHDAVHECRVAIARLSMKLFCVGSATEQDAAASLIADWYEEGGPWKSGFEAALTRTIQEDVWPSLTTVLNVLVDGLPDEVRSPVIAAILPILNERLVQDPPSLPAPALTELLDTVSHAYPKLFFKPLFACAAASKEMTVVTHLRIVAMLAKVLPSFWTSDVDMMLVALMSGSTPASKKAGPEGNEPWGQARPGQLVILAELIAHVQKVAQERDPQSGADAMLTAKARFFFALEYKLGNLLEAKERSSSTPVTQRIMLSVLFYEIRVLLRSLKQAPWLSRLVRWVVDASTEVDEITDEDPPLAFMRMASMYTAAQETPRTTQRRQSAFLLSPSLSEDGFRATHDVKKSVPAVTLSERRTLFDCFGKGLLRNACRLFVVLFGLLTDGDYERLSITLWRDGLQSPDTEVQAATTFLLMQSAEKIPEAFLSLVRSDVTSTQPSVRRDAAKRISVMSAWRYQLLSQTYITDKNHRRPFKLARGPIAFMPTDIGSGTFVLEEDPERLKTNDGTVLPHELRKRLADIGWTQEDNEVDQKHNWDRTPLSLLPLQQVERLDGGSTSSVPKSPLLSPGADGVGRPPSPSLMQDTTNTSSTQQAVKRRPIFAPSLASILLDVAFMTYDLDYTVASAARSTILDLMRDDPSLITRPVLDSFAGDEQSISSAISVLRAFLHIQRILPPAMAHHLFNHLTGFLKFAARQPDIPNALLGFAYSLPLLSKLVTQVSDMSIREIRRAKVEIFLIPSGSLWFPPTAPPGEMFPRVPGMIGSRADPDAIRRLAYVTVIRISQHILFLNMLQRNPQDVQAIRKNMSRLVLPSMTDAVDPPLIELRDYIPRKQEHSQTPSPESATVAGLSLMLARSYVLLVAEIFKSMPRHLNDRNELAVLINGLNRILLAHGDDIGIVGHVLVALMTASTRFRRIFLSGGGYTLFMPVIMKVYAESELNFGIRAAIEYATNRFYALHQEAFVFQTLDILSQISMLPDVECNWMAEQAFTLLYTLRDKTPLSAPDVAGIHDSNKTQEREALLVTTAEDKPQAFLSLLRRGNSSGDRADLPVPEEYEGGRLNMDDLVRLFLTVIGHDPGIRRAEHFLRLLQLMAPSLYEASSPARNVLRDGINALAMIFLSRSTGKAKVPEATSQLRSQDMNLDALNEEVNLATDPSGATKRPSDLAAMRLDCLSLVAAFTKSGGYFSSAASQRIFELVKIVAKDSSRADSDRLSTFLSEYAQNALLRHGLRLKHVLGWLSLMAPVFKVYAPVIDLSGVLSVVSQVASDPVYANEPAFSRMIVSQYCVVGLEVCELAASEGLSLSLPLRPVLTKLLCQALFFQGVDIIGVLERQPLSYEFLAGIIYPIALVLPLTENVLQDVRWTEEWRRTTPSRTWTRLLGLVMNICRKSESARKDIDRPRTLERTRSQENRKKVSRAPSATTLSISIQIMKVIIVRAEKDLSASIPGIWIQLGLFFKELLSDGNARFALESQNVSIPPSPLGSPLMKSQSFEDVNPFAPSVRSRTPTLTSFSQPRLLDYLLWSLLEFACLHRSPLMLQLRILMQEKAVLLDQQLRQQVHPLGHAGNRLSFASAFSKSRRRSGQWSGAPSPDGSPLLTPAKLRAQPPPELFLTPPRADERQPGYARSPMTPHGDTLGGPRIVHLGPVRNADALLFRRSPSPHGGGGGGGGLGQMRMWGLAKTTKVRSAVLVRATYRRIRVVQQMMGYGTLLPILEEGADGADEVRLWSRVGALRAVAQETEQLMEEFNKEEEAEDDDTVMVDPDQSLAP